MKNSDISPFTKVGYQVSLPTTVTVLKGTDVTIRDLIRAFYLDLPVNAVIVNVINFVNDGDSSVSVIFTVNYL